MRNILNRTKELFYLLYFLFKANRYGKNWSLDNLTNFITIEVNDGIKAIQAREEISKLLVIIKKMKPTRILEIGTGKGGTLFLFSCITSLDAQIISIDLPGGFGIGVVYYGQKR